VRRAAETLLPLAAAVIVTCALLSLGGRQLNIFHLVSLLLVVGVGSNYTLFFRTRDVRSHRSAAHPSVARAMQRVDRGWLRAAVARPSARAQRHRNDGSAGRISPLLFATILAGRARA
jgi:predicted RND superfamily exporter protein